MIDPVHAVDKTDAPAGQGAGVSLTTKIEVESPGVVPEEASAPKIDVAGADLPPNNIRANNH